MPGVLRFFLDPGAGGVLWAGDAATKARLGLGPVDADLFDLAGRIMTPAPVPLAPDTRALRDALMEEVLAALDLGFGAPSWDEARIEAEGDRLLALLRQELAPGYVIKDERAKG